MLRLLLNLRQSSSRVTQQTTHAHSFDAQPSKKRCMPYSNMYSIWAIRIAGFCGRVLIVANGVIAHNIASVCPFIAFGVAAKVEAQFSVAAAYASRFAL